MSWLKYKTIWIKDGTFVRLCCGYGRQYDFQNRTRTKLSISESGQVHTKQVTTNNIPYNGVIYLDGDIRYHPTSRLLASGCSVMMFYITWGTWSTLTVYAGCSGAQDLGICGWSSSNVSHSGKCQHSNHIANEHFARIALAFEIKELSSAIRNH